VQNIGSIKNGDWADNANDGFTGQRIDEISASGNAEITGTQKANIVLVHAGTNDMVQNANVTSAPARLGSLIDKIISNNPDALVLVAQIIVNGNTTINDRIKVYNQALPALAEARSSTNRSVRLVNMDAVLAEDLLLDGTHPNEKGYMKMANAWYTTIVQAGKDGLIRPAAGPFVNRGNSSLPTGGRNCLFLTD
jgi:lysophospholipase L1-like esterase